MQSLHVQCWRCAVHSKLHGCCWFCWFQCYIHSFDSFAFVDMIFLDVKRNNWQEELLCKRLALEMSLHRMTMKAQTSLQVMPTCEWFRNKSQTITSNAIGSWTPPNSELCTPVPAVSLTESLQLHVRRFKIVFDLRLHQEMLITNNNWLHAVQLARITTHALKCKLYSFNAQLDRQERSTHVANSWSHGDHKRLTGWWLLKKQITAT